MPSALGTELSSKLRGRRARPFGAMHSIGILELHRNRSAVVGQFHFLEYLGQCQEDKELYMVMKKSL